MAIRKIVTVGDPVLRKISRRVENFDAKLWTLLDDMKDTLKKAEGAGLAAVQVGVLRRVVLVDIDDGKGLMELINPEIVEKSEETEEGEEGCLSVPNQWGLVKRPISVTVRAQNRKGQWCLYKGEGLRARCFCHELDHLDGHLYTDFVSKMLTEDEVRRLSDERIRGESNV
ncbi:MAG: peptide deformylase [Faecalibacterium sp.]|nr:peptide deformylase [Ruminococcus sp.]MCM1392230.1 peptide deformylase [Ruminococcus sp.]MCM1484933.1 peptide deformylase [Faecalibacterium sp.]